MDTTAIFIIVVSTVLAIVFKVVIFKKIRNWMDQDLINGLAGENADKKAYLLDKLATMKAEGVARKHYQAQLTEFADQFEQSH